MKNALNYRDVILKSRMAVVDSRSQCDVSTFIAGKRIATPVVCANMKSIMNQDICKMFDDNNWFHVYHRKDGYSDIFQYIQRANEESWRFISPSIGIKEKDAEFLRSVHDWGFKIDVITIDVAHSWQDNTAKMIRLIKRLFPKTYIIVGNGDNPDWIKWLISLGVNCAKINIGVSQACRTREYTGFGSSTVTDLINCASSTDYGRIAIMADGGLTVKNGETSLGDVAKAIRFGASYVMSGSIFSQCLDSPAALKGYYGNASEQATGSLKHVEGATVKVTFSSRTMRESMTLMEDSLRSSVSYSGGRNLCSLQSVDYQIIT